MAKPGPETARPARAAEAQIRSQRTPLILNIWLYEAIPEVTAKVLARATTARYTN